ncbi:MAG: hypothetical protein HY084_09935 [Gemmatimonadetes bacterium]|nr:hypothetical protein [Gemmatimonadota bacterium]
MSSGSKLFAAALVASLAAVPATAQSASALAASRALPAYIATDRAVSIADAQRLVEQGRLRDARNAFRRVALEQMDAGEYAAEALNGLARTEFALNDLRATASTLDLLASEAARFGDPEVRLRSLVEAALTYQDLGDRQKVADLVPAIQALLKSPVISEATRRDVASRLVP